MSNAWPATVPVIVNGESTFDAETLNPIINALTTRTELLQNSLTQTGTINGVGFTDSNLGYCEVGQFVAYDTEDQVYKPAMATWSETSALPGDLACVLGVVISKISNTVGTILTSGVIRDASVLAKILPSISPGNYYLSGTTAGAITASTASINFPVYCGTCTSTDCFIVNPKVPDFRTHTHTQIKLNKSLWANGTYTDTNLQTLSKTHTGPLALVLDNQLLVQDVDFTISGGTIKLESAVNGLSKEDGVVFTTNPFTGVVPWITSVAANDSNALVSVNQVGTTAVVDVQFPENEGTLQEGTAITSISSSKGITTGAVVHGIEAGAGITVEPLDGKAGVYTISTNQITEYYRELNIINGSGVIYGGSADILFKFPKGRPSSLVGTVRAPSVADDVTLSACVFMYVNSGSTSSASCSVYIVRKSDLSARTEGPAFSARGSSGAIAEYITLPFNVQANDLINVEISFSAPAGDVSVRAIGVVFTATYNTTD